MPMRSILPLFMIFFWLPVHAQWVQNKVLTGGHISALHRAGTTLFTAHNGGIHCSIDEGLSWQVSNANFNALQLCSTTNSVFASNGTEVIRSQDDGQTWDSLPVVQTFGSGTLAVLHDTIYFTHGSYAIPTELYRSTDEGSSWTLLTTFASTNPVYSLSVANERLYLEGDTLMELRGTTAQNLSVVGLPISFSRIEQVTGLGSGQLLARVVSNYGQDIGIYQFNGLAWTQLSTGLNAAEKVQRLLQTSDSLLFLGTVDSQYHLYTSSTDGLTWTAVPVAGIELNQVGINRTATTATGYLFSTYNGIYHTSDSGKTCTKQSLGIYQTSNGSIVNAGANTLLTCVPFGGIFRSADGGASWNPVHGTIGSGFYTRLLRAGNRIFYFKSDPITFSNFAIESYRSADNGASWNPITFPLNGFSTIRRVADTVLYVFSNTSFGAPNPFYRSRDYGTAWESLTPNMPVYGLYELWSTIDLAASPSELFLLGNDGYHATKCYRSTDQGASWTSATNGLYSTTTLGDRILQAGSTFFIKTPNGSTDILYKWTGNAWEQLSGNGLPPTTFINLFGDSNRFYLTTTKGLYTSIDGGHNWTSLGTGLPPNDYVSDMTVLQDSLFATTGKSGIWVYPPAPAAIHVVSATASAVFPNPADAEIRITVNGEKAGEATLLIYSMTGRLIERRTIHSGLNDRLDMRIRTADYPTGFYTYRLLFPDQAVSGKFAVVHAD